MNTEHYKAAAERTDADERALIPGFKRTPNKAQPRKQDAASHSPRDFFNLSTPTQDDKAYAHHEYSDIDVRNLTRGQLIESYADLKHHADKLAQALRRTIARLEYAHSKVAFDTKHHEALNQASEALAAYEDAQ